MQPLRDSEPDGTWQPEERLSRAELQRCQLARLADLVERVAPVPFYRDAFRREGLSRASIRSLDDLRRLPMTTKEDLRHYYPLGFLAVPRQQVIRIHGSSGTTGKPTFVAYTRNDLVTWADLCARALFAGGLRPGHTAQVAFGYGLFTGGFGLHYGIERIGAAVVPAASGNTDRQLMLMQELQADALICTPSYALRIAEVAAEKGVPPDRLSIRFAHLGGEPWTEEMRPHIEAGLAVTAFNNYGLSEVMGPGVSGECRYRDGMHIQEDHFLVECLHPETLEPVADGEPGELVFTTLTKEAFPLLRYRTRDIATLTHAPCPCGRNTVRMSRVTGRTDDMLIIRGVNVFPSQVEEALLQVEGTAPHYLIEVSRPGVLDEVTVHVEVRRQDLSDRLRDMQALRDQIVRAIQGITGVHMAVHLVEPQTLERSAAKARRVLDKRFTHLERP